MICIFFFKFSRKQKNFQYDLLCLCHRENFKYHNECHGIIYQDKISDYAITAIHKIRDHLMTTGQNYSHNNAKWTWSNVFFLTSGTQKFPLDNISRIRRTLLFTKYFASTIIRDRGQKSTILIWAIMATMDGSAMGYRATTHSVTTTAEFPSVESNRTNQTMKFYCKDELQGLNGEVLLVKVLLRWSSRR